MKQPVFEMERWQSLHEHRVAYNLSESGVHPLTLSELLEITGLDPGPEALGSVEFGYSQSDGTGPLRERIAALYPGATAENVIVTTGSAEANFAAMWQLVEPGDHVVILQPTYGQTPGLAEGLGARVTDIWLEEELGWQPAPGAMATAITPDTRLVVVTTPNNPTGSILREDAMEEIAGAVERTGAWLLADEVYAGAELPGHESRSFWGRCARLIVTASLSKAYGLPGLRVGWAVAPPPERAQLWARKDYTTIAPSSLSDRLATAALEPECRAKILSRTRRILVRNLDLLSRWLDRRAGSFTYHPPEAGAICLIRHLAKWHSVELAERLRTEKSVLIIPGKHFRMESYIRIGFGIEAAPLMAGLERFGELLDASPDPAGTPEPAVVVQERGN